MKKYELPSSVTLVAKPICPLSARSPSNPPWIAVPFQEPEKPVSDRWDLSRESPNWNAVPGSAVLVIVTERAAREICERSVVRTASVDTE